MNSESSSKRRVIHLTAGLVATLLLAASAMADGADSDCGVAEACLVMSTAPTTSPSTNGRRNATHNRAADRKVSREATSTKAASPAPTFVATNALSATAYGATRGHQGR